MAAPKHVLEIYIRATPEAIWEALTDPERSIHYYFGTAVRSTWEPDARYEYVSEPDGTPWAFGTVIEVDPPRRLVTTFEHRIDGTNEERPSRVTWEIEPRGESCLVRLVHDDFHGPSATFTLTADGWPKIVSGLKTYLETGTAITITDPASHSDRAAPTDIVVEDHRDWGRRSNGRCWELLERTRSAAEDRELVDCAHASLWHWRYAGTPTNEQRGEWMVSHVYAVVGNAPEALRHAERCLEITESEGLVDFDRAYAYEAMSRALGVADHPDASTWHARAEAAGEEIADPEDRSIFLGDFNS